MQYTELKLELAKTPVMNIMIMVYYNKKYKIQKLHIQDIGKMVFGKVMEN